MELLTRRKSRAGGNAVLAAGRFVLNKGVKLIALLLAVSAVSFTLVQYSPIDPVQAYIGADMMRVSPEQREAIVAYWGLDKPPLERYASWLASLASGDFGNSMIYRRPVIEVIQERFAASFALMGAAWLLSGLIGFAAGALAAMNRSTWIDKLVRWYCYTLASTPTFGVGLVLLLVFSVWLGWFPVGLGAPAGVTAEHVTLADRIRHMILPAATLSVTGIAALTLHTREKLMDVTGSDYWLFARARGERGKASPYSGGTVCAMWRCPRSPCSLPRSASCSAARYWPSRCSRTRDWARPQ